jgi:hypothetical protein
LSRRLSCALAMFGLFLLPQPTIAFPQHCIVAQVLIPVLL